MSVITEKNPTKTFTNNILNQLQYHKGILFRNFDSPWTVILYGHDHYVLVFAITAYIFFSTHPYFSPHQPSQISRK